MTSSILDTARSNRKSGQCCCCPTVIGQLEAIGHMISAAQFPRAEEPISGVENIPLGLLAGLSSVFLQSATTLLDLVFRLGQFNLSLLDDSTCFLLCRHFYGLFTGLTKKLAFITVSGL